MEKLPADTQYTCSMYWSLELSMVLSSYWVYRNHSQNYQVTLICLCPQNPELGYSLHGHPNTSLTCKCWLGSI